MKHASRDTNIRAFAIHARGARGERTSAGFARRYTTFPSPFTSVRHHVAAAAASLFPRGASLFAEQGASFQRRCFAFTFPSPSRPSNNDGLHSRTHRVSRALLDHSFRQLALPAVLFSFHRNFLLRPLETICSKEREGKESREIYPFSCHFCLSMLIGEQVNLLKLCVLLKFLSRIA